MNVRDIAGVAAVLLPSLLGGCRELTVTSPEALPVVAAGANGPTHELRISVNEAGRAVEIHTARLRRPFGAPVAYKSEQESGSPLAAMPANLSQDFKQAVQGHSERFTTKFYRAS